MRDEIAIFPSLQPATNDTTNYMPGICFRMIISDNGRFGFQVIAVSL